MTSPNDTAYPQFKDHISPRELDAPTGYHES